MSHEQGIYSVAQLSVSYTKCSPTSVKRQTSAIIFHVLSKLTICHELLVYLNIFRALGNYLIIFRIKGILHFFSVIKSDSFYCLVVEDWSLRHITQKSYIKFLNISCLICSQAHCFPFPVVVL